MSLRLSHREGVDHLQLPQLLSLLEAVLFLRNAVSVDDASNGFVVSFFSFFFNFSEYFKKKIICIY